MRSKIVFILLTACIFSFLFFVLHAAEGRREGTVKISNFHFWDDDSSTSEQPVRNTPRKQQRRRTDRNAQQPCTAIDEKDLAELQKIAVLLGIPETKAKSMSISNLLFEIRCRVSNSEPRISVNPISAGDMKDLEALLADDSRLLKTIKNADFIIQKVSGKRILIFPEK